MSSDYRQRANLLLPMLPLLEKFGVAASKVFRGTGIAPEEVAPGAFLPYAGFLAVLDRAAELTAREDLGVMLAENQTLDALGPAGTVVRSADTLGNALNDYAQFQIWNSTGGAAYLYRSSDEFAFGYGIYDPAGVGALQIHDLVLAAGCKLVFILTENRVKPLEIWSMRPPPSNPAPLAKFAGCPVLYGQDQTCIFLPPSAAEFPLKEADRATHDMALARLAEHAHSCSWGTAGAVRHAIRAAIVSGHSRMPEIARQLGQHPRKLRRALAREETTFIYLRDEVLFAVACELLALTALSVGQTAAALSFADTAAFTHAFRLWSGTSPSTWRRMHSVADVSLYPTLHDTE